MDARTAPDEPDLRRPGRRRAFRAAVVLLAIAALAAAAGSWWWARSWTGVRLNRRAWEASYVERGETPPETGPRSGYWGALGAATPRDADGWLRLDGRFAVDPDGRQFAGREDAPVQVLVIGASVAGGAYASTIDRTWFHLLQRALGDDVRIVVATRGGALSGEELSTAESYLEAPVPDLIVQVSGLNDLVLQGRRMPLAERSAALLRNAAAVTAAAREADCAHLFVVQPCPFGKALTDIERRLVDATFAAGNRHDPRCTPDELASAYASLPARLRELGVDVLDAGGAFDGETATTFADVWHFADHGHRLLADRLVPAVRARLDARQSR